MSTDKQSTRKAGSIRQYTTLGKGKTSERSDVQAPEHPNIQESEHLNVTTPKSLDTQETEHPGTGTPKRERHTIYLPPDLSMWVKVQAVTTKREISEIVTEALERYKSENT